MKLGGIYISVRAKTTQLDRDLLKAKTKVERTAIRMEQAINKISFAKIGVAAAAFAAAYAYGMKKAIDAASDLQEVQGKFDVVFRAHKDQAEDMAKVLVDSYAMSTREAKQYLSSVQDLLVPMGMAADKATLMSNEVVKLAADLGSFNNLPTATVMLDMQSALVGNFETMKKYGVILNETVIKQEALNSGLWDGKGMVDANTKAQVAFKLMIRGSAAAIGDLERTQDSYANQTKKLSSQFEDLKATIGTELLPVVTEWVKQLNLMIEQNPQLIKQLGEISAKVLEIVGGVAKMASEMVSTLASMGDEIGFFEKLFWGPGGKAGFDAKQASARGRLLDDVGMLKAAQRRAGIEVLAGIDETTEKTKESISGLATEFKKLTTSEVAALERIKKEKAEAEMESAEWEAGRQQDHFDWLTDQYEKELSLEAEFQKEKLRLQKEAQEEADKLAKERIQTQIDFFSDTADLLSQFSNMMSQMSGTGAEQSRSEFNRQKNLNMAQAAMSTAAAVTKALNFGSGGYTGMIMAGLVAALGAVQIATISKQEYKYAKGGAFTNGVVNSPTAFNNSVMGEAGPEAIMPLAKTPSGELGIKSSGESQPQTVNYVIHAVDSKSFLDLARRNPDAITGVINEQIQRGNSALNSNIRRAAA